MEESLDKSVFSDDYAHFEQNHTEFPVEARAVFSCVASLREALGAFRKATENKCVVSDDVTIASVVTEEEVVCEAVAEASLERADDAPGSPTNVAAASE